MLSRDNEFTSRYHEITVQKKKIHGRSRPPYLSRFFCCYIDWLNISLGGTLTHILSKKRKKKFFIQSRLQKYVQCVNKM